MSTPRKPMGIGSGLPRPMSGQAALDALGDRIEVVAKRNGMTPEKLEALLLRDASAHISPSGFIMYIDTARPTARSTPPSATSANPEEEAPPGGRHRSEP